MLAIDGFVLASPRLPPRGRMASTLAFVSVFVHVSFAAALVLLLRAMTREGFPSNIRVTRSLYPGGLDEQAIGAVRQWRFAPGRLGGTPVDVLVTVVLDFSIH